LTVKEHWLHPNVPLEYSQNLSEKVFFAISPENLNLAAMDQEDYDNELQGLAEERFRFIMTDMPQELVKDPNFLHDGRHPTLNVLIDGMTLENLDTTVEAMKVLLLTLGADVNAQDIHGVTALQRLFLVQLISSNKNKYASHNDKETMLLAASSVLLEHGADPTLQDMSGKTVLHVLGLFKLTDENQETVVAIVKKLLEYNADPVAKDKNGETPLHVLVARLTTDNRGPSLAIIRLLMEHGAGSNVQDNQGVTPLHALVQNLTKYNQEAVLTVIMMLLACGADPVAQDKDGQTVLHYLTKNIATTDILEILAILLQHGADPTIMDNSGNLPVTYVNDSKLRYLLICGEDPESEQEEAERDGEDPETEQEEWIDVAYPDQGFHSNEEDSKLSTAGSDTSLQAFGSVRQSIGVDYPVTQNPPEAFLMHTGWLDQFFQRRQEALRSSPHEVEASTAIQENDASSSTIQVAKPRSGKRTFDQVVSPTERDAQHSWNTKIAKPASRPTLFHPSLSKAERPMDEFDGLLERLMSFFKRHSIRGIFSDTPSSVKLQSVDLVEFVIKFWEAPNNHFCVDIQRHSGDQYRFRKLFRQVLDIVNHSSGEEEEKLAAVRPNIPPATTSAAATNTAQMQGQRVCRLSTTLESTKIDSNELTVTVPMEQLLRSTSTLLTSLCFSQRSSGLGILIQTTDLRCTTLAYARDMANVVLGGQAPRAEYDIEQDDLDQKCRMIQDTMIQVLVEREFHGDDDWKAALDRGENSTCRPFMSYGSDKPVSTSTYENGMIIWIHKVLIILSNSLEVLFLDMDENPTSSRSNGETRNVLDSFMSWWDDTCTVEFVSILAGYMEECYHSVALATLACRTLRLFSSLYPPLRVRLQEQEQNNERIMNCIELLDNVGQQYHHSILQKESQLLRDEMIDGP